MFKSYGYIRIEHNKIYVELDNDIIKYYKSLYPKYYKPYNYPRYNAHISVIRNENVDVHSLDDKYNGKKINFIYSPYIHIGDTYIWLEVECTDLSDIRVSYGLEPFSVFSKPPSGVKKFHITIGNFK